MAGSAPRWLCDRLASAGGSVPFRAYMDWVLHDPQHGYYGSGRACIGPRGDFATSPSLGEEFAALLLPQLCDWLRQLGGNSLSLVEAGPGEGQLAGQLLEGLRSHHPVLAAQTELLLLEPNPGMVARQRHHLGQRLLPGAPAVRWTDWGELHRSPVRGVVIAHEVLDALPVERIRWDGDCWRREHVALEGGRLRLVAGPPLLPEEVREMEDIDPAAAGLPAGWCTEIHSDLLPWFQACGRAIRQGVLLVIDYALPARRYYSPSRPQGTLMAYQGQRAGADPLLAPGEWDLTAHLCLEAVERAAQATGWTLVGERRQGEALLALGLSQRLSQLGQASRDSLAEALQRREQLLRLVDPLAMGEFRWLVFARTAPGEPPIEWSSRCLEEPEGAMGAARDAAG